MKTKILSYKDIMNIFVDVPEGEKGDWKISRFEVDEAGASFHNLRCSISGSRRTIETGIYTKLTRKGCLVMSDTPAEKQDHCYFLYKAKGDILINGLGLGWVVEVLLKMSQVTSITVIEISSDLIELVSNHYYSKDINDKLIIINADALTWKPPKNKRYDVVWNDIWDDICSDNLENMKKLHRRYGRRSDWVGSWCRAECEYRR